MTIKRHPASRLEQLTHDIYGHGFTDTSATHGENHGLILMGDGAYIVDFTQLVKTADYVSAEFAAALNE